MTHGPGAYGERTSFSFSKMLLLPLSKCDCRENKSSVDGCSPWPHVIRQYRPHGFFMSPLSRIRSELARSAWLSSRIKLGEFAHKCHSDCLASRSCSHWWLKYVRCIGGFPRPIFLCQLWSLPYTIFPFQVCFEFLLSSLIFATPFDRLA